MDVSMPFRAGTPFLLHHKLMKYFEDRVEYQCPFGLELHFYGHCEDQQLSVSFQYQCPFGLELHFYGTPSKA